MYLWNSLPGITNTKVTFACSTIFIFLSFYSWKSLYSTYKSLKSRYQKIVLHRQRHNCVVMYHATKGYNGWPPFSNTRVHSDISTKTTLDQMFEPIVYFINTATFSLDIAVMLLNIQAIHDALLLACRRGIRVRILLNFEDGRLRDTDNIQELKSEGIDVSFYVSQQENKSSIMHYKFMIKDYIEDMGGYVVIGSMNLTNTGFLSNYEDLVFSSNRDLVAAFHDNFVRSWNFVQDDNKFLINMSVLQDANLL